MHSLCFRRTGWGLCLAAWLWMGLGLSSWAQTYTVTDLGSLGGAGNKPTALNLRGHVVGSYGCEQAGVGRVNRSFIHRGAGLQEIITPGQSSQAAQLDAIGDVVGWFTTSAPGTARADHAFLFQPNGQLTQLGTLGGMNSRAYGLNAKLEIVGVAQTTNGFMHAFLWRPHRMEDLGTLGGNHSYAHAVNSAQHVVGVAETPQLQRHAFLWRTGKMEDLGTLGGGYSQALHINESDDIVGMAQNEKGVERAFLKMRGPLQDLGTLGGDTAFAYAINQTRQIVGVSQTRLHESHGFLWENNVMKDLNTLLAKDAGFLVIEATAINDLGQIVGLARDRKVQLRAVLLNPPPDSKPKP